MAKFFLYITSIELAKFEVGASRRQERPTDGNPVVVREIDCDGEGETRPDCLVRQSGDNIELVTSNLPFEITSRYFSKHLPTATWGVLVKGNSMV